MDARPDDDADNGDRTGATPPSGRVGGPSDDPVGQPPEPVTAGSEPDSRSEDEVWASIVARLADVDAPADPPVDQPRGGRTLRPARRTGDEEPAAELPPPPPLTGRDWDGTSQYDDAEDAVDELEHFVPEDPGPVLGGDPLLTLAWGAAVGAPLLLLVVAVVWRDAPSLLVRAAVVVFLVAVAVLVWRMPHRREPSDGDGAVV